MPENLLLIPALVMLADDLARRTNDDRNAYQLVCEALARDESVLIQVRSMLFNAWGPEVMNDPHRRQVAVRDLLAEMDYLADNAND